MINKSISVVIPAYNEGQNIEKVVESISNFLNNNFPDFEIIIVDDGSRDSTYKTCILLQDDLADKIKIIRHGKNKGYGAALRSGLFSTNKDLVFYTDSDNQFDISDILKLIEFIDSFDLVIGYRINRQDAFIRKLSSKAYNLLIRIIFGLKVKDIDCSFKLFTKGVLKRLSIERDNFFVDTELLLKAKLAGFRLKEVGVKHSPRTKGKSSVKFFHIFVTISDIFYFWPTLRRKYHGDN